MKPYIKELHIYANGYSSAIVAYDKGELKTVYTPSMLEPNNPNFGHERQLELVKSAANEFIALVAPKENTVEEGEYEVVAVVGTHKTLINGSKQQAA